MGGDRSCFGFPALLKRCCPRHSQQWSSKSAGGACSCTIPSRGQLVVAEVLDERVSRQRIITLGSLEIDIQYRVSFITELQIVGYF